MATKLRKKMIYEHRLYLLPLFFVILFLNACQSINVTELPIFPKIFRRPMTLFNNFELTFQLIHEIGTNFPQVNDFEYILDTVPNDKQIAIYVQGEHSLVHYNTENKNFPIGNISVIDRPNELYHCRIVDPDLYLTSDIIIEYSMMNIYNMESTSVWRRFLKKVVYVPAIPFDYEPSSSNGRNESISTTIIYLQGRRYQILHELNSAGITTTNHAQSYTLSDQSLIYSSTKILLNIHQSENHHTLEEFRVLPALLRGVIVVSEDIPIKHVVPYHNYIIWSQTKDLHDTLKNVSTHYEYFYERIHGKDSGLRQVVEEMKMKAKRDLEHRLLEVMEDKANPTMRTEYSLPDWVLHPTEPISSFGNHISQQHTQVYHKQAHPVQHTNPTFVDSRSSANSHSRNFPGSLDQVSRYRLPTH